MHCLRRPWLGSNDGEGTRGQEGEEEEGFLVPKPGLAERILEQIPCDRWVSAREIAEALGITSHAVGATISQQLFGIHVERRPRRPWGTRPYEYRRKSLPAEGDISGRQCKGG